MYIVLLHFKTGISQGYISCSVFSLLCQRLRIVEGSSFHEVPAVCSLFNGIDISKNRTVVIARLHFEFFMRFNDCRELTAVPCVVSVSADLEADLVSAFH